MEIKSLEWWEFTDEPTEGCELRCPTCGGFSVHTLWKAGCCDDCCMDWDVMWCPKCGMPNDFTYQEAPIEVRNPSA